MVVSKRTRFTERSGELLVPNLRNLGLVAGSFAQMLGIASLRRSAVPS